MAITSATIAGISLALTAAGTGVAVYGAVDSADKAKEAGENAQRAEDMNAQREQDAAGFEAANVRRKNLLRLGSQRAAAAKSGVLIDDSAGDVIYDAAIQGELEALATTYGGASAAAYYRSRGANASWEAGRAASGAYIGAGGSIIGGLSKAAGLYKPNQSPTFNAHGNDSGSVG